MKAVYGFESRNRRVKLTLDGALVVQARSLTDNLSGVVESLLAGYVERERQQRIARTRMLKATIATWNDFDAKRGSFADEYSPL